jgi:hypothetical protein
MFLRGLGATNSFIKQTVNVSLIRQDSDGVWSEKAGTFNITPHHWTDIANEINPIGAVPGEAVARAEAYRQRVRAAASGLPACPVEAQTAPGVCYYGRYTPALGDDEIELVAPFTVNFWGVVFGLTELAAGKFQRTLVPTDAQRKQLELAVIRKSQQRLFGDRGLVPSIRQPVGDALIYESLRKFFSTGVPSATDQQRFADPSVDDMMRLVPDIALFLLNFERNPVQPTPTERTGVGGWKSWLARGGYPLSRAVASAQTPIGDRFALQTCVSMLCRCGDNGAPSCVPAVLDGDGLHDPTSASGSWASYIAFSQDPAAPWVQVTIRYEDPSKWDKMTNAIANVAEKFGKLLCETFGSNQAQFTAVATAEICTDASGKACAKGAPGCTCKKPSAATQASVSASAMVINKMCGGIMRDFATDPLQNLPPPVNAPALPPPMGPTPLQLPWWLIALGGLGIGVVVASRR